jgi:hypothetical protein
MYASSAMIIFETSYDKQRLNEKNLGQLVAPVNKNTNAPLILTACGVHFVG